MNQFKIFKRKYAALFAIIVCISVISCRVPVSYYILPNSIEMANDSKENRNIGDYHIIINDWPEKYKWFSVLLHFKADSCFDINESDICATLGEDTLSMGEWGLLNYRDPTLYGENFSTPSSLESYKLNKKTPSIQMIRQLEVPKGNNVLTCRFKGRRFYAPLKISIHLKGIQKHPIMLELKPEKAVMYDFSSSCANCIIWDELPGDYNSKMRLNPTGKRVTFLDASDPIRNDPMIDSLIAKRRYLRLANWDQTILDDNPDNTHVFLAREHLSKDSRYLFCLLYFSTFEFPIMNVKEKKKKSGRTSLNDYVCNPTKAILYPKDSAFSVDIIEGTPLFFSYPAPNNYRASQTQVCFVLSRKDGGIIRNIPDLILAPGDFVLKDDKPILKDTIVFKESDSSI